MRERDGTLREADENEKIKEAYRIWGKECIKMIDLPNTRLLRRLLAKEYPKIQ